MLQRKEAALAALCFALIVTLSAACSAQSQGGQAAPPSGNATASPAALPGDSALPAIDVQLHVSMGPPAGTPAPATNAIAKPGLPFNLAMEAANAALEACLANGYPVGVAVTDENGQIRVGLTADGAAPRSIYTAVRKDITAAAFKMATSTLRVKILADPSLLAQIKPNMAVFPGALPLMVGDRAVGAIGVSGATGNEEERCAKVGAEKIQARLK